MKLFFKDLILYEGIRQVELSNIHKHEEIIDELAPESIMAETTSENEIVLIQAEQNFFQNAFQLVAYLGSLHAKAMNLPVDYFDPQAHYDTMNFGH
jgi:hypothetical protein